MSQTSPKFSELLDKKIVGFRGFVQKKMYLKKRYTPLEYILFEGGELLLHLDEQDYYTYHDCSSSARQLNLLRNKVLWNILMNKEQGADEPMDMGFFPFAY
jgi:hypothetical protein